MARTIKFRRYIAPSPPDGQPLPWPDIDTEKLNAHYTKQLLEAAKPHFISKRFGQRPYKKKEKTLDDLIEVLKNLTIPFEYRLADDGTQEITVSAQGDGVTLIFSEKGRFVGKIKES